MVKVFIINGKPQTGKDTFVTYCNEIHPDVFNIHTSTPMKETFTRWGWTGEKSDEIRDLMAFCMEESDRLFGTSKRYVAQVVDQARRASEATQKMYLVFIHSREPKNIKYYVDTFEGVSMLLERDGDVGASNPSDNETHLYQYDIYIDNNGTLEELEAKVKEFVKKYTKQGE